MSYITPLSYHEAIIMRPPELVQTSRKAASAAMKERAVDSLLCCTGVYNQRNWDAIDAIIQMASEAGVKLIIPFADK